MKPSGLTATLVNKDRPHSSFALRVRGQHAASGMIVSDRSSRYRTLTDFRTSRLSSQESKSSSCASLKFEFKNPDFSIRPHCLLHDCYHHGNVRSREIFP
jgi:hypothetical protein